MIWLLARRGTRFDERTEVKLSLQSAWIYVSLFSLIADMGLGRDAFSKQLETIVGLMVQWACDGMGDLALSRYLDSMGELVEALTRDLVAVFSGFAFSASKLVVASVQPEATESERCLCSTKTPKHLESKLLTATT